MLKEKLFYLECLKDGRKSHKSVFERMKKISDVSATVIRDMLLEGGYIKPDGYVIRHDGKKSHFYVLTGKQFVQKQTKKSESITWEDGTMKSKGNAFDWQNFSKGLYTQSELAATENGRRWGVNSASKKILPMVRI